MTNPSTQFKPGNKASLGKGRPSGSKNKVKPINVAEVLASMNYEPFAELVNIARNARSEKVRCDAAIELCSYVAPKLKQIEHKTDGDMPFTISLNLAPNGRTESINVTPKSGNDNED